MQCEEKMRLRPVHGTLWLSDAAGKRWSQPLSLGARQSLRLVVADLLRNAGLGGKFGGITVDLPASASALDSVHFLYDEGTGFSALMNISTRDPNARLEERVPHAKAMAVRQWTLRAPMLALTVPDAAAGFPANTVLQPAIFVRNTTSQLVRASLALDWQAESGKGKASLPALALGPYETRLIEIDLMQKQLGIPQDAHWALATLSTNAAPDSLIAVGTSYDVSGRPVPQVRAPDQSPG